MTDTGTEHDSRTENQGKDAVINWLVYNGAVAALDTVGLDNDYELWKVPSGLTTAIQPNEVPGFDRVDDDHIAFLGENYNRVDVDEPLVVMTREDEKAGKISTVYVNLREADVDAATVALKMEETLVSASRRITGGLTY